jgi:type III restriction enzyme
LNFDSDTERRFAVILENDPDVLKWFKPSKGDFQIHYSHDSDYEPDFVVETKKFRYLCEPKGSMAVTDVSSEQKAKAAALWCRHATAHGGKGWKYLLIPHDKVDDAKTVGGLAAKYAM